MSGFTLSTTSARPFEQSVTLAREALAEAGFGILTGLAVQALWIGVLLALCQVVLDAATRKVVVQGG